MSVPARIPSLRGQDRTAETAFQPKIGVSVGDGQKASGTEQSVFIRCRGQQMIKLYFPI